MLNLYGFSTKDSRWEREKGHKQFFQLENEIEGAPG